MRAIEFINESDENQSIKLGHVLSWPEFVNKISSMMKATGWKSRKMGDNTFMFITAGTHEDEWFIIVIDNVGDGFFSYGLGTVEEGQPYIDDSFKGELPTTEASLSELMEMIRDGYNLSDNIKEGHGWNLGYQGGDIPRALDAISELKLRPQAVEADELVDVYVVGSHKGREISRQVARSISNKKIPAFTNFLVNKYNIDPTSVVYGPAKEEVDEAVIATAPGQASTTPVSSRYDPAQLAATQQRLANTQVAMNTGRLGTNNVGIQTSAARG